MKPTPRRHSEGGWLNNIVLYLFFAGMALYGLGTVARLFFSWKISSLIPLIAALTMIPGVVLVTFRFGQYLKRRLFFKVRNRIIFFYLFAGLVPLTFILLISTLVILLFFSNLSLFIFRNELKNLSYRLYSLNAGLVETLYNNPTDVENPEFLHENFQSVLLTREPDLPDVSILYYRIGPDSRTRFIAIHSDADWQSFHTEYLPDWLQQIPYSGTIIKNYSLFLYSHNPIRVAGNRYYLDLFIPFRPPLFKYLLANSSVKASVAISETEKEANGAEETTYYQPYSGFRGTGTKPIALDEQQLDQQVTRTGAPWDYEFPARDTFDVTDWFTSEHLSSSNKKAWVSLKIPFSTIMGNLASKSTTGELLLRVLLFFSSFFLGIEVISIVVGFVIIRSVTRSVALLNRGTMELNRGNFNFEIAVNRHDELGELSRSFNTMAKSIQRLLNEVVDKQRIKRELEIAREVQQNFFPRIIPRLQNLTIAGRCLPAREVSGDFYDFIQVTDTTLDVVVGDISGKGISAALLMASLQSAIRAQPVFLSPAFSHSTDRLALLMETLNRHLLVLTPVEKFATAFYACLQPATGQIHYCNAGHEAPFLIRPGGEVMRCSTGGTILGAFPDVTYEVGEIATEPGDILVVFTDGLLDAMNQKGEEFGEDRLSDFLNSLKKQEPAVIMERIYGEVSLWARGMHQHDDITIVVARQE